MEQIELFDYPAKSVPQMPEAYKGDCMKQGDYIKSIPRKWTNEEIEWMLTLEAQGYSRKEIAESIGRNDISVGIKLKRLKKRDGTYNEKHIEEKYYVNRSFVEFIKPKSAIDLFCGTKQFYSDYCETINNDKNENIPNCTHELAERKICELWLAGCKADIVDLDPFGSAYDCFDFAIKMAQKGLVITLGEMGHKRFKRLDFVNRYYGIDSLDDFTTENLIKHIQAIGARNKKTLEVWKVKEWHNIARVWFVVKERKITEQWGK